MEEKKDEKQDKKLETQIKELVADKLKKLMETGVQAGNIDYFGKLIDIHKDLENEDYWNVKKEDIKMRYNYGENRGEYLDGGYRNYGRRGVPGTGRGRSRGRYRGPQDEAMENMMEHYDAYSEAKDEINMGNYGAEDDSMRSLDNMLKCACIFMDMLEENANSPEELQLIKKYKRKIAE